MMNKKLILLILFTLTNFKFFSQDIIIKRDSSKISAKIINISQEKIVFYYFNEIKKKEAFYILKSRVKEIIFADSTKMLFNSLSDSLPVDTTLIIKVYHVLKDTLSIRDYINFNLMAGFVINSSFSNVQREKRNRTYDKFYSKNYSPVNSLNYLSYNFGFNFIFGRHRFVKHELGVNYLLSKGDYSYDYSGTEIVGNQIKSRSATHIIYHTKIGFLNLVTGLRVKLYKGLTLSTLISFNLQLLAKNSLSGNEYLSETYTTKSLASGLDTVITTKTYKTYNNLISTTSPTKVSSISFCPKISYDFNINKEKVGVYVSYNASLFYRLPWWMVGVTWYPFKKLR